MSFLRRIPEPETLRDALLIEAGEVQIDATGIYRASDRALVRVLINSHAHDPAFLRAWLELIAPNHVGSFDRNMDPARVDELVADHRIGAFTAP